MISNIISTRQIPETRFQSQFPFKVKIVSKTVHVFVLEKTDAGKNGARRNQGEGMAGQKQNWAGSIWSEQRQQTGAQQAAEEPTATQKMWHGWWRITSSKKGGRLVTLNQHIHHLTTQLTAFFGQNTIMRFNRLYPSSTPHPKKRSIIDAWRT